MQVGHDFSRGGILYRHILGLLVLVDGQIIVVVGDLLPGDKEALFRPLAAGFLPLAVFGSLFIGLILLIFSSQRGEGRPYILIVTCACREAEEQVKEIVKNSVKAFSLKSKTVTSGRIELNYEVRLKDEDSDFINALAGTENVTDAVLVSYNGDYMG